MYKFAESYGCLVCETMDDGCRDESSLVYHSRHSTYVYVA